jgi:hypothetical protein
MSAQRRYNPFRPLIESYSSNDHDDYNDMHFYDEDPTSVPDIIQQSSKILDQCQSLNTDEVNQIFQDTSTSSTFSSYFQNIDGNKSNFDTFTAEISRFNEHFSAIGVAETNTHSSLSHLYQLTGYTSYYQDPFPEKSKGTGVALYIHNSLNATVDNTLSSTTSNLETLFVKVTNTNKPITIGVLYRPPNGNFENFLTELRYVLELLPRTPVYIMGDFNVDLLGKQSTMLDKFEELILTSTLSPLISIYTHDRHNCNKSCIDNILSNNQDNVTTSGVITDRISHHLPIFQISLHSLTKTSPQKTTQFYDYSDSNVDQFYSKLSRNLINDNTDFSQFLKTFQSTLDETCKLQTPKHTKRNHNNNPWITTSIIESIKTKQTLYRDWKRSCKKALPEGDYILYLKYKDYRKRLKSIIKYAKSKFYCKKILDNRGNSKKTWQIINQIRGKGQREMKPQFVINNERITERRKIANAFNEYFTSIATKMNNITAENGLPITEIPSFTHFMPKSNTNSIFMADSTADEIEKIICGLTNGKASDIPVTVIKRTSNIISPILARHFNQLMQQGTFPSELKVGKVTPIYKKDNQELLENYRPISILPIFGKLFEKIIYRRLYSFFVSQGILHEKQFGFREGHSTSHALNYSMELVQSALKRKQHVLAIFIDLSKAFDTLDHNILLDKLLTYGIRGSAHKLISSYLTGRSQYTTAFGEDSSLLTILFGVPQGSCLGPLLFLIYINDLCNSSTSAEYVLFADDTNIFVIANSKAMAYKIANNVLSSVYLYMKTNKLHINMSKTCHMLFSPSGNRNRDSHKLGELHTRRQLHALYINNILIKRVEETRFLGVTIDSKLSWVPHIENLQKKLKCQIGSLNRIKDNVPAHLHNELYHTLFESHLRYGITVWGHGSYSKLEPLFNLQKKCLRIMFGDREAYLAKFETCARCRPFGNQALDAEFFMNEHSKPLFNAHNLLTLYNLYNYHASVETLKILKYRKPISLYSLFTISRRKESLLITPSSSHDFIHRSSTLWNLVRQKFKIFDFAGSIGTFKTQLKNFILKTQKTGDNLTWNNSEIDIRNSIVPNYPPNFVP